MENTPNQTQSYPDPQTIIWRRKSFILMFIGIVLYFLGVFIYRYLTDTRLVITSEADAQISMAFGQNETFVPIGKSKVTYTQNGSISVFIQAEKDGRTTQKYIAVDDGDKAEMSLSLSPLVQTSKIAGVALSHLLVEDNRVIGINPSSRSISSALRGGGVDGSTKYLEMPFVDKIHWYDSNNFVFNSPRDGVGIFANGSITKRLSLSGKPLVFGAFTQHEKKPLILMSRDGLYKSDDRGVSVSKIVAFTPLGAIHLSSNDNNIFFTNTLSPEALEGSSVPFKTEIKIYNYSGDIEHEFIIEEDIGNPVNIVDLSLSNKTVLLTDKNLVFIDKQSGSYDTVKFHAVSMEDVVLLSNDRLLLFGSGGLWFFDNNEGQYTLAAALEDGEKYVADSLIVVGDKVYYSVQMSDQALRNPNSTASNAIYELDLD